MPASNTYESISSVTLTNDTTTSIDFSNIPSSYTDLIVVAKVVGVHSANETGTLRFLINNDSATNYSWTFLYGYSTTIASSRASSIAYASAGYCPVTTSNTNKFATIIIHLNNYSNTTTNKTIISRSSWANITGVAAEDRVSMWASLWRSTAAIDRLTFNIDGTRAFRTNSNISLYGIKAA